MLQKLNGLREARRAVALVWRSAPGLAVLSAALALALSLLPLASLELLRTLLDRIAARSTSGAETILPPVLLLGVVALLSAMGRSASMLVGELQGLRVADAMKTILHAKSVEMDLEFYENPQHQDTLRRAQQEAPFRPVRIVNALLQCAQSGLSLLAVGGFLALKLHWGLFAILALAAAPGIWVRARQARENFNLQRKQTSTERAAAYIDLTMTNEWFAKELRLFGLGDFFSRRSQGLRAQLRGEKMALAKRRTARELVMHFSTTAAVYGGLGFLALRAAQGLITLGSLVMFYQAIQRVQASMQEFLSGLANLHENNLFLKNLSDFLDLKPRMPRAKKPRPLPEAIRHGLVFEDVSFSYPGKSTEVLRGVSFTLRPGQKLALVGENGSGKTTLVKLMCRLYDPTHGRILLDGVDLRDFDVAELRARFSVIFQDFVRYQMTLAENVGLGDLPSMDDRARITAAGRKSGAHEFIERFPQGYDTLLGRAFHDGEEISGGEWQKVALARAFLRDAPFIIMDEPSSAMDPRAEFELFKRFAEMAAGRTAVLISHRLSTVRMADAILMLDHGQIIERGAHDELTAAGGAYARLFEMQASHYR